ncbi:MAG: hypothetical protein AAF599_13035, partial [Bacteroidota bacterium]
KIVEHFKGAYTLTAEDVSNGFPLVQATFYSEHDVKVYLHYVNIEVVITEKMGTQSLEAAIVEEGIRLSWQDEKADGSTSFRVYRKAEMEDDYQQLGQTKAFEFLDSQLINGVNYTYLITRLNEQESGASNLVSIAKNDQIAPAPPTAIKTIIDDTEVKLTWTKSKDKDVAYYSIYRGDEQGNGLLKIADHLQQDSYEDFSPQKGIENTYVLYAHDYSGNKSVASTVVSAKVKAVFGASFRDLILPMPIHQSLTSALWGAANVLPRDSDNGAEHPNWSYWGGHPIKGKDGKYHMYIARWPEKAVKGHWEWPNSTVAHVVADQATGPYQVKEDLAYNWDNGKGHNPDITPLNDGSYMLHLWQGHVLTAPTINGPWTFQGDIQVNYEYINPENPKAYQYFNNLTGVQREDGSFLFMTKFGKMMQSDSMLGPYEVLTTDEISDSKYLPEKFRNTNYEDPTIWRDEVQYHCLINAFIAKRAIYLRSPDGIRWKFDPGVAYDPDITSYEDGTRTHWYKLERPHVLQDKYGRATHLSLAALDIPKRDDLANDQHNSKNIIVPLTVHKRLKLLNKKPIDASTRKIKILLLSENGFDATPAVDIASLGFGASEVVNFGGGAAVVKSKQKGKDLLLIFDGKGNGINTENFAGKLLGRTRNGELLIGFVKLQ